MTLQIKNTPDGLGGSIEVGGQPRLVFNSDGTLSGNKSPLPSEINTKKLVTMDLFDGAKATNGYQKLPSGLIIQWGSVFVAIPAINSIANTSVNFPITFPNACLSVNTTPSNIPQAYLGLSSELFTRTGFQLVATAGQVVNVNARFIAIGH